MHRSAFSLLLAVALCLTACSGGARTTETPEPVVVEPVGPTSYPAYETFDPSDYDAEPPDAPARAEVEHDVPAALMAGTIVEAEPDEPRTVQGFRIQTFSSESKATADGARDALEAWWEDARRGAAAREAFPYGFGTEVVFNRPYYRVRGGAFEFRDEADAALRLVRERFPEAFIVPDRVTLRPD